MYHERTLRTALSQHWSPSPIPVQAPAPRLFCFDCSVQGHQGVIFRILEVIFDRVQRPLDHPVVVKKERKSREKRRDRMFNLWKNGGGKVFLTNMFFPLCAGVFMMTVHHFPPKPTVRFRVWRTNGWALGTETSLSGALIQVCDYKFSHFCLI